METGALSVEPRSPALDCPKLSPKSDADPPPVGCVKNMDEVLVNVVDKPLMAEAELVLPYIGLMDVEVAVPTPELNPSAPL